MSDHFDLRGLKVGDRVTRFLAGAIPMTLVVRELRGDRVLCVLPAEAKRLPDVDEPDWEFDLATGAEVDEYLGWGPAFRRTGSFIRKAAP